MPRVKERRRPNESLGDYLERLRDARTRAIADSLPRAWGDWLNELGKTWPWDWFGTYTFSDPRVTPAGARHFFCWYLRSAGAVGLTQPYAFRVDEYGTLRGRLHLHALIGNVSHLLPFCGEYLPPGRWGKPCCWIHRWPCGYARILPFDPKKGACYYLSNYITKALGDWELIGFDSGSLIFPRNK